MASVPERDVVGSNWRDSVCWAHLCSIYSSVSRKSRLKKTQNNPVYQTAVDGYNEMASMFLENPELARNLLKDKPAQLSEVDAS